MTLKHTFQSTATEASSSGSGGGNGIVGPNEWNADHTITGTANGVLFNNAGSLSADAGFTYAGAGGTINMGNAGSNVNYIQASGATSGNVPTLLAAGNDTNIGLILATKATGALTFSSTNGTFFSAVPSVGPNANYLAIEASTAAQAPSIVASGSDSNISITLNPKNTGLIQFGNAASVSASSSVAITWTTGIGPTGSHTTIQGWLTILDNTGTTRYIPFF